MNAQKKGAEIILTYMAIHGHNMPLVKECSLAAVDIVINAIINTVDTDSEHTIIKEWKEAKQYIEDYGKDK
jgi:hypothetical protein